MKRPLCLSLSRSEQNTIAYCLAFAADVADCDEDKKLKKAIRKLEKRLYSL